MVEEEDGDKEDAPGEWGDVELGETRRSSGEEMKEALGELPQADPVLIHLVPFASLGGGDAVEAESAFVIQSGFAARPENAGVHRLSRIVLQLAVLNFMLALCLELFELVVSIMDQRYLAIISFLFWVGFAYYVMWLGVQGVRTRNGPCCSCSHDCGYLQAFQFIYVVFAVLRAVRLLVALVYIDAREIVFNFLLLLITAATAEYSRQLLVVIQELPPIIRARVPPSTEAHSVPMATATQLHTDR